jgi:hypothetical protein
MDFKIGQGVVLSPSFYRDKLLGHTLRGLVKEVKWNMVLVQFSNGQVEWIDSKYLYASTHAREKHDPLTSETK